MYQGLVHGRYCLDRDELGLLALCYFAFFEDHIGEGTRKSSRASGPLHKENIEGNSEMYYDASES